ncbi:MAG: beta-N-acetylhexosaminidase [Chitinophagaceae bacterium]
MKKIKFTLIGIALMLVSEFASAGDIRYPLIPMPEKLTPREGSFQLSKTTKIVLNSPDAHLKTATDFLVNLIHQSAGYNLAYAKTGSKNSISFIIDSKIANDEGYTLLVAPDAITVKSKTPAGAFMAIQTLRQLMPAEVEEKKASVQNFAIPAVEIEDAPRFGYRGLMLDVGRYFLPMDFIKKYIDALSFYKINTFHLHLTEDQGWRIEIKKYPRLQEVSAWRNETTVGHARDTPRKYDGKKHGGYYTQAELKELVKFAQDRFITIIPEIEMPGHSQAALAAYPSLGCVLDTTYNVSTSWGVHKDVYCPKEETFKFLEDVLTEVISIFPSKYIHIGGDECPKDRWKASAFCQQLIKEKGLKDEHGLQSYFIRRIEKFLNSKGRAIIGWDEILEGGLAPNATVMSWRGENGGIEAARQNHNVVMTPNTFLYIDYYQTKEGRAKEPLAIGGFLPLEKVYSYNPVPADFTPQQAKYILGAQANLWTEYVPDGKQAGHMTFPRVCALAELSWTPDSKKNYADFKKRLTENVAHLSKMDMNFAPYFMEE